MVCLAIPTRWGRASGPGELICAPGVNLLSFYALGVGPAEESQSLIWGQWPVDNCDESYCRVLIFQLMGKYCKMHAVLYIHIYFTLFFLQRF